ncbi:unnamed protein product, partial [Prorocentrum cordatum]
MSTCLCCTSLKECPAAVELDCDTLAEDSEAAQSAVAAAEADQDDHLDTLTELREDHAAALTRKEAEWADRLADAEADYAQASVVNPDNYDERNKFRTDLRPLPAAAPIFKGMRLCLTQNVLKSVGRANGPTLVKVIHANTPWTDVAHGRVSHYPVRLGHCSTIHKVQGDQFARAAIWVHTPRCEGAACAALSRVSRAGQATLGAMSSLHVAAPGEALAQQWGKYEDHLGRLSDLFALVSVVPVIFAVRAAGTTSRAARFGRAAASQEGTEKPPEDQGPSVSLGVPSAGLLLASEALKHRALFIGAGAK